MSRFQALPVTWHGDHEHTHGPDTLALAFHTVLEESLLSLQSLFCGSVLGVFRALSQATHVHVSMTSLFIAQRCTQVI